MMYKSKVDIVYEQLLSWIIQGKYKQGDRLVISHIARTLNISEIPVREAIRRLESEGYLKIYAIAGSVIDCFDKNTLTSIFQIKSVLEGYASRLSIDYITEDTVRDLEKINDSMRNLSEDHGDELSDLNMQFHLKMYECIPNHELYTMIVSLWNKWRITRTVFKVSSVNRDESVREHERIIELLQQKEYDELELYVRNHKLRAGMNLINSI